MAAIPAKITSKWQVTIPKRFRRSLNIPERGTLLFDERDGELVVRPQRKRRELLILKYRGWLKHLDDGRPIREIREDAHRAAAAYAVKRAHRR